jgi:hypothetical protein
MQFMFLLQAEKRNVLKEYLTSLFLRFHFHNFGLNRYSNASEEVVLDVKAEKTLYMLMPHHQNARQNHNIKVANRFFRNAEQFKYMRQK